MGWIKENMSGVELSQWMAYYRKKNEEYDKRFKNENRVLGETEKLAPTKENFSMLFSRKIETGKSSKRDAK